jgi:hypothetical protein
MLSVSTLFFIRTFTITYDFARNVLFLIHGFFCNSCSLAHAPMLLTRFGVLRIFAWSTMWYFPKVHLMLLVGVASVCFWCAFHDVQSCVERHFRTLKLHGRLHWQLETAWCCIAVLSSRNRPVGPSSGLANSLGLTVPWVGSNRFRTKFRGILLRSH